MLTIKRTAKCIKSDKGTQSRTFDSVHYMRLKFVLFTVKNPDRKKVKIFYGFYGSGSSDRVYGSLAT